MPLSPLPGPTPRDWDARILAAPGAATMFQTYELAEVKRASGWTPRLLEVEGVAMTVLQRTPPGFGPVWYLPKGPCVATVEQLAAVLPGIREAASEAGAMMVKVEPEIRETPENVAGLEALGLVRAGRVQTNSSTVLVDVTGSEDDIMARFPAKTRNMVRRARREGVEVHRLPTEEDETYARLWRLWAEVVEDQELAVRDEAYYTLLWRTFCEAGLGQVFLATHEGVDVAASFVTVVGDVACYKDGASVRERPVPGASQLVQLEGMLWANERGARVYDLCGTPHSTRLDDPEDPFHGIGRFKRGFNPEVTDYVGALDLPLSRLRYAAWVRGGDRVAAKLVSTGRGDSFY